MTLQTYRLVQEHVARAGTEDALAVALNQLHQHQLEAQAHQVSNLSYALQC